MGNHRKAKPTSADKAAATRLRAAWDQRANPKDLTQDKMAALMGGTQGLVSQYINGLIPLNYRALMLFADALNIDPLTIRNDLPEQQLPGRADDGGWVDVQATTQGVALGSGALAEDYVEAHQLKFRANSLRGQGLKEQNLEVYYGRGDSMEPRIKDGDAILVNKAETRILDDKIYFIRHEGHYFVKRLQTQDDMVFIVSDNKDNPQWRKPLLVRPGDDFEVIGRVRWIGSWEE